MFKTHSTIRCDNTPMATFTHQIWWVMVCYDLAHQIRWAKHTFSGRCDITPMVCCSFGGHSTPQFLPARASEQGTVIGLVSVYIHSNSPNPGALGPGTACNSEMSISGNSQSSTSLYIVSYRHKFLLYMYMYTTIKNTSSVTILWKILCNFSLFNSFPLQLLW